MIPIGDEIKTRKFPFVNYALILINVVIFIWQIMNIRNIEAIFGEYALSPTQITSGLDLLDLRNVITSMFMHGSWVHLLGNMLYLWIFGDNVEDRLGHLGYLVFYLLGGMAASAAHVALNLQSEIPIVGASGAIAAVLGAYLVFYPRARVYTFIPIGFFARLRLVPAIVVLGLWFLLQLFTGFMSLDQNLGEGGVAIWAHVGGFVFGLLVSLLFKRKKAPEYQRHW
ncbi:MAG: rhomboid family intramembrane serine protease [Anaerolineaceae bacterium]|jgi:membrane associated rhomboid family serine protease